MLHTLTEAEKALLDSYFDGALSSRSKAAVKQAKKLWTSWARDNGKDEFPANPADVALWCIHLHKDLRRAPQTIHVHLWGLGYWHTDQGQDDPTLHPIVRRVRRTIKRKGPLVQGQAPPLRGSDLRRITRRLDTSKRVNVRDIAMLFTMRDAMLRVYEACRLEWEHITLREDGMGWLHLPPTAGEEDTRPLIRLLSEGTMEWLQNLQAMTYDPIPEGTLVFGLSSSSGLMDRFRRVSTQADLPHFTSHSVKVGAAQDLAESGASLAEIMRLGRWKTADSVTKYVGHLTEQSEETVRSLHVLPVGSVEPKRSTEG